MVVVAPEFGQQKADDMMKTQQPVEKQCRVLVYENEDENKETDFEGFILQKLRILSIKISTVAIEARRAVLSATHLSLYYA